ncbi:uncharacterized protein J8A68_004283 [[Candida] subhashii]|uniref:WD40 repeat-like protein n=1 Tax=[Candida] subhashii TaxID=561895 RepID=A0A8J5QSY1_9ASCO|nr:uncharacterized protein J8A68_004283 [[Candida] subhashii]KAG7662155.1 hypothetical protein J8A68_004283 [[Candida] subhashii]
MATTQIATPPPSNGSQATTTPKRNFFSKLIKKKSDSNDNSKQQKQELSTSHIPTPRNSNGGRRSSVSRGGLRRSPDGSKRTSIVDYGDESLYNGDEEEEEEEEGDYTLNESFLSSVESLDALLNKDRYYSLTEKVQFPPIDTELTKLNLENDEEPPWNGLTYESFITPKYVKVSRKHKKSPKVLNNLFLAQELNVNNPEEERQPNGSTSTDSEEEENILNYEASIRNEELLGNRSNEILTMEFSKDGKYLAAAGRDSIIRIWKVISSPLGRLEYNNRERENGTPKRSNKRDPIFDSAPVFHRQPTRIFRGHTQSVLTLAWSKNNFLISGSMDKTVKLWHVDREKCLQTFHHEDFVTAVKFHPLDDRFFMSGSLDNHVRLWSVLEKSVSYIKGLGEDILITALSFTPNGSHCVIGGFNGSVFIMETKGLYVIQRFEIMNRSVIHFGNKNGNKITGIKIFENPLFDPNVATSELDKWAVLITTNDSKIRLSTTTSKKLITRFKGLTNNSSSIVAGHSDDNRYIVSGSEDHYCYVWENNSSIINNRLKQSLREFVIDGKDQLNKKSQRYSRFIKADKFIKKLLDDGQRQTYEFVATENNSYSCFHAHHSRCNAAIFAPEATKKLLQLSDDIIFDLQKRGEQASFDMSKYECSKDGDKSKIEEELQAGHIIVTTDQYGLIRVYRQDCAHVHRKRFVAFYKHCQAKMEPKLDCPGDMVLKTGRLSSLKEIPLRKKPARGRSSSPNPIERKGSGSIKKRLSSSMRQTTNVITSAPSAISSAVGGLAVNTMPKVISSSSLMNLKGASRSSSNNALFNQADMSMTLEHPLYAGKNESDITLNLIPNQKAQTLSSSHEQFPSLNTTPSVSLPMIITPTNRTSSSNEQAISLKEPTTLHEKMENLKISPSTSRKGKNKR